MATVKMPVQYNDYTKTTYFQKFDIKNSLPEIGVDEWLGVEILAIEEAHLDSSAGRYEEITQYDFYKVKSIILPIDDDEEGDVYYDYIAIPKEEDEDEEKPE